MIMDIFFRVPELLFQPSMIGVEHAGIVETLDYMFKKYTEHVQQSLAQVLYQINCYIL